MTYQFLEDAAIPETKIQYLEIKLDEVSYLIVYGNSRYFNKKIVLKLLKKIAEQ